MNHLLEMVRKYGSTSEGRNKLCTRSARKVKHKELNEVNVPVLYAVDFLIKRKELIST